MKKEETKYKEKLLVKLRALPNSYWFVIQQIGLRGSPDILGLVSGFFVALEVKKDGSEVENISGREKLQEYVLGKVSDAGGLATFIHPDNERMLINYLQHLSDQNPLYCTNKVPSDSHSTQVVG